MATKEIKRIIEISTGSSTRTIRELRDIVGQGRKAMQDLDITSQEFADTAEVVTSAQNLLNNAMRGTTAAVEGSYNAYSAELSALKLQRKALRESSEEYKQVTARIVELNSKLVAMDAEIGVYGRNVGNYSSAFAGLNLNVSQVVRELPSLTMGANQFFLAISNNLPMLVDSMVQVRKEAGGIGAVIKGLGKALFSWNTVITLAITLLSAFGKDIIEWVSGLFSAERQLDATTKATRALREELNKGNTGVGEAMVKVQRLSDAWRGLGDNLQAKEKFVRDNVAAFEALGVAVTTVEDAEKLLVSDTGSFINAMRARAAATASMNMAVEAYERVFQLQRKRDETPMFVQDTFGVGARPGAGAGSISLPTITESEPYLNPDYTKIVEEVNQAKEEARAIYNMLGEYEAEYQRLMSGFKRVGSGTRGGSGSSFTPGAFRDSGNGTRERLSTLFDPGDVLSEADAEARREALRAQLSAETAILGASAEERLLQQQTLNEQLTTIEEMRLTLHEIHLRDMLSADELSYQERASLEEELSKVMLAQIKLRTEAEQRAEQQAEQLLKRRREAQEAYLGATAQILGAASDIAKEGTVTQKSLATAEAIINTYAAANKTLSAYAGVPIPGYAWAQMAATIAMGLANVKAIWATDTSGNSTPEMAMANGVPPSIASTMPASYTRNLVGDSELTELNKPVEAYVVQSRVTAEQDIARQREQSASF